MTSREMTAAELLKALENDPRYLEKRRLADEQVAAREAALKEDGAPLIEELNASGIRVTSLWDLIGRTASQPAAIPILVKHVSRPYLDRNREAIARALAVPQAAYAWPALKDEYEKAADGSGFKVGLADALSVIANESVIGELAALAKDPKNGESRQLLLAGLRRSNSSVARTTLMELSCDPILAAEIASWENESLQ